MQILDAIWRRHNQSKIAKGRDIGAISHSRIRPIRQKAKTKTLQRRVRSTIRISHNSFMSVPNLKPIAQFVQKLLRGSQNLEISSRDPGHAHLGVDFMVWTQYGSVVCLCQISSRYLYSFKSYKGVPKFRNLVTWPRPGPLMGRFMIWTQ